MEKLDNNACLTNEKLTIRDAEPSAWQKFGNKGSDPTIDRTRSNDIGQDDTGPPMS